MQFCYLFPDRVERLVLVSSGGLGRDVSPLLRSATLPGAEWVLPLLASDWLRGRAEAVADDSAAGEAVIQELRQHVSKVLGPIAKPRQVLLVAELPKTRSGKIMRRLLRDVAEHREMGDVTTLADPTVMNLIGQGLDKGKGSGDE